MKSLTVILMMAAAVPAGLAAADAQAGLAAYQKGCKGCHGSQGEGNQTVAKMMHVTLPNLASKDIQGRSDADIKKVALEGKGKMKPVKTISPGEIDAAISYVRTLGK